MNFLKHFLRPHKEDSGSNTPVHSNAATPITSPVGSIVNVDAAIRPVADRYYNDPMRTNKKPDAVGTFYDPMGGHGSYTVSRDVTNTGA
ncbi:uncharacterized protein B0P05DRAFT_550433 [Gilbertella persicaria]|uniref:Uncharacterized protein n=1 Tax=Rhizopus stolonifer TaxID=4846 RepID=A0A367KGR2_RHIST|nr:uncharacterized protein B0P05DRAFT_550433 [Gilbertella persicaria]KAI8070623.1 hypothetical protein B0P05DRAFT_550433 [Gilbertella persicaria]RCI01406.1 hypothetical protein CU098_011795 [Rhizopus stolonifer]